VALFGEDLCACAAVVEIGPARQSFWALLDRRSGRLHERTRLLPRAAALTIAPGEEQAPGLLAIADDGVELRVSLHEAPGIQALCAHGAGRVWTRKQAGIRAHGTLAIGGEPARPIEALAVIDDTCGHHARVTEWRWSAGVGGDRQGRALAWNLVSGVNDPPRGSERAVWVDGVPSEPGPVEFAADLSQIRARDGSLLHFSAEAERSRHDRMLLLSSEYRAPFGSFSGSLPGAIELAWGAGVMEHHRARW
jgi:hypothetical protein